MEEQRPRTHSRRRKKRPEDANQPELIKKVESLVITRLLRIFGVLFILASLFYAVSSADKLIGIAKNLKSSEKVLGTAPSGQVAEPATVVASTALSGTLLIWAGIAALAVAALLLFSVKYRSREIPRILVIVFYAALLFMAKQFGWQIHILFPLVIFFSGFLYYNGTRLHSTLVIKVNVILAWLVFGIWFVLKIILGGDRTLLFPFFLYSGLLFILFLATGIFNGFKGHSRSSKYTEVAAAAINIILYVLYCSIVLLKFGFGDHLWLYYLMLGVVIIGALYFTGGLGLDYNRGPYLFSFMFLFSMVLPMLVPANLFLFFFAVLSVFLLAYAQFSKNQAAILLSLFSMTIMLMIYLYNWIFQYGPVALLGNITMNTQLYNKGLMASFVIVTVLLTNIYLLKGVEITLSKKWFTRKTYLRLLKGLLLFVLYLGSFWVLNYPLTNWLANDSARFLIWFTCSCMFFIIAIPVLGYQKSSFLKPMVWFSLIVTIAYPLLVHLFVLELRNEFLKHEFFTSTGFYFHYAAIILLVINLAVTGRFIPVLFKENTLLLQFIWVYFILTGLFLLLSEFDHLMIVNSLKRGVRIEDIAAADKKLPYTIILMVYSFVILIAGLVWRSRFFRAVSLVMLTAALVKILYTDLSSLEGTGRILLLIILGTVLLVISFFYTRIRRLFTGSHSHRRSHGSKPHHGEERE